MTLALPANADVREKELNEMDRKAGAAMMEIYQTDCERSFQR